MSLIGGAQASEGPRVTAANSSFAFGNVPIGDYLIEAALPGFETRNEPVSAQAGAVTRLNLGLQISRVMESITVVTEEPRSFAPNAVAEPIVAATRHSTLLSIQEVTPK